MTPPLSHERLEREAAAAGFEPATFEKVLRLLDLLNRVRADSAIGPNFVLKGGTALNLFVFSDVPRLSVDIDLNYIGEPMLERMRDARPALEDRLKRLLVSLDLAPRRIATSHAGGNWILPYRNALGTNDRIEIDLNYVLRVPLWDPVSCNSAVVGPMQAINVPTLDDHELAGGKLVALLTRTASRDLFDAHHLFTSCELDSARLRLATVVYGAMSNTDWRTVDADRIPLCQYE